MVILDAVGAASAGPMPKSATAEDGSFQIYASMDLKEWQRSRKPWWMIIVLLAHVALHHVIHSAGANQGTIQFEHPARCGRKYFLPCKMRTGTTTSQQVGQKLTGQPKICHS